MTFEESKMISHLEKIYPFYPKGCQNSEAMESGYELGYTAGQESRQPEIDEQCRIIGMSGERELALRALVEKMREVLFNADDLLNECGYGEASNECSELIAEADKFLGGK